MAITAQQALAVHAQAELLYSQIEVETALTRMATEINAVLKEANPLILCVMTGGVVPAGKLLTLLDFPLNLDYIHATRYGNTTQGGELEWLVKPACALQDRVLLVIDDILDEGFTLAAIIEHCRKAGAKAVYSAVLVDKLHPRKHGMRADFKGLDVPDRYVFGYGMDYKGYLRNAPGIFAAHVDQSS